MSRAEFYRLVSAAIRRVVEHGLQAGGEYDGVVLLACELEHTFAKHNKNFDPERFRRDCGIE